jgi:hypothetical protein
MKGKNPTDFSLPREIEHGGKLFRRTELDIDIFGHGQESKQEVASLVDVQIIRAAFSRMPRCDNDWSAQCGNRLFHFLFSSDQMIKSKFEEVWRMPHPGSVAQFGAICDHADDPAQAMSRFDRFACYHILLTSQKVKAITSRAAFF